MIGKDKNISIIDKDVKITGTICSESELIAKGDIAGILRTKNLTIAKGCKVSADINSASVIIGGDFEGEIKAGEEIIILAGGKCSGKLHCKNIVIKKGAIVNASIAQTIGTKLLEIKEAK
jgi:cytoskeletal protein CcmA (bactofilin family)